MRAAGVAAAKSHMQRAVPGGHHHASGARPASTPLLEPQPVLNAILETQSGRFGQRLLLWQADRTELAAFGGELDMAVQMPGWTNVWTMPIQNRVDMLSTGVNTPIGIRVLGRNVDDVVRGSEAVAPVVKPLARRRRRGRRPDSRQALSRDPDRSRAGRRSSGCSVGEINDVIETALAGKVASTTVEGRERHPILVRCGRRWRDDEESIRNLPVTARGRRRRPAVDRRRRPTTRQIPLSEVATVRGRRRPGDDQERERTAAELRPDERPRARRRRPRGGAHGSWPAARDAKLPAGVFVEWTGQFEHDLRARRTLLVVVPLVVALILLILYWTYHDLADAMLMMLAVPGAIAGGLFFQWLLGLPALGHGLGRLHRLLRHGDLDRNHHAGVPARGNREGRRPRADEPARAAHRPS